MSVILITGCSSGFGLGAAVARRRRKATQSNPHSAVTPHPASAGFLFAGRLGQCPLSATSGHPAGDLESPLPRQRVAVDKLAVRKDVADVPCV